MTQTYWNDFYHGNAPVTLTGAAVFKAGEGIAFTDPQYTRFLAQAAATGHHAYAYYALHLGSHAQMIAQGARALSLIGRRGSMFDCERWPAESGSAAGMVSLPDILDAIAAYRVGGGTMNVIYLPRSQWMTQGQPDLTPLVKMRMHLVNANYRAGSRTPGSPAWDSYGGMPVWAVQYAPCHNTARGTWAQAQAVWEGTPNPAIHPAVFVTVESGDTFNGIARENGLTPDELHALNPGAGHPPGNLDLIYPGDRLMVVPAH